MDKDKSQRRRPRVYPPLDENYRDERGRPMKGTKAWWAYVEERNRKIMAANPDIFERYCAPQLKQKASENKKS